MIEIPMNMHSCTHDSTHVYYANALKHTNKNYECNQYEMLMDVVDTLCVLEEDGES